MAGQGRDAAGRRQPSRSRSARWWVAGALAALVVGSAALDLASIHSSAGRPGSADPSTSNGFVGSAPLQTMQGFGASGEGWPPDLASFPPAVQRQVADMLFGPSGIRLSMYRYDIGAGAGTPGLPGPQSFLVRAGTYDWSADPGGLAFLRLAARDGVPNLVGFANSAPGVWKTNGKNCGGGLVPADTAAYAAYLTDVVAHLREADGITLSYVSPMNEPDFGFGSCYQEGMAVPPAQRATLIADRGGDLARRAPWAHVIADESSHVRAQLLPELPAWLGRPGVARYVAAIAYHDYGTPQASVLQGLAAAGRRYGKPLWMTEICCVDGHRFGRLYDPTMASGLWLAGRIWSDVAGAGASSFSWWRALSSSLGCDPAASPTCAGSVNHRGWDDGLLYYDPNFRTDGNTAITTTKRYWVFGNFSRYVRPGAVRRPAATTVPGVRLLAFSSASQWTVIVIDDAPAGHAGATLRLRLPTALLRAFVPSAAVRTSATLDLARVALPSLDAHGRLVLQVPPQSVTTYVFGPQS